MNKSLLYSIVIVALAATLYLIGSAKTGFQGTDELRYGQIAKELGPSLPEYFLLHFNGVRYTDKPPLYFWAVKLGYVLTGGVSPLGLRLPGVASAIGCFLITFFLMKALTRNERLAFLAALTLMITPRFLWIARWGRLDIMMCVFIYAGMLQFVRAWFEKKGTIGKLWFWVCVGLSFAVKGPAGPVVLLGGPMTFLIWEAFANGAGAAGFKAKIHAAAAAVRPLFRWSGIIAALAINLAWYGPITVFDRTSGSTDMVVNELVNRTFAPDRHVQAPPYYLKNIWYDALPAMPFVLFAFILMFLDRRAAKREGDGQAREAGILGTSPSAIRFLFSWFVFTFVFFSIYPPKRAQYLLPMYPALVGMFVVFLEDCAGRCVAGFAGRAAWCFRIPAGILLFALVLLGGGMMWRVELGGFAAGIFDQSNPETASRIRTAIEEFEYGVYQLPRIGQIVGTLLIVAFGISGFGFLIKRRVMAAYATISGATYAGILFLFGWMIPPAFPDEDLERFAVETAERLKQRPGLQICMYGEDKPFYNIYGDFHVHYFEDKEVQDEFFSYIQLNSPVMVILEDKEARKHGDEPPLDAMTRRETTMRGERVVVFETPE